MSKTVLVRLFFGLVVLTTALTVSPASAQEFDPNAYYVIRNVAGSKVLDVSNNGCCNGASIHIWTYEGLANQPWRVIDVGNGYYKIVARHSGKALDVESASMNDFARVHQWTYQGLTNQQWRITWANSGYASYYITARHSGKALTVNGGSVYSNGTGVKQFTYYGPTYLTQQWWLEMVP
jgi:hypothetical protein